MSSNHLAIEPLSSFRGQAGAIGSLQHDSAGWPAARPGKDLRMMGSAGIANLRGIILVGGLLIIFPGITPAAAIAQSSAPGIQSPGIQTNSSRSRPVNPNEISSDLPVPMTDAQKQSLMRANFAKSKSDAEELATLAKGLRDLLDKSSAKVPPSEIVSRADKIERLAKKIRDETKGF